MEGRARSTEDGEKQINHINEDVEFYAVSHFATCLSSFAPKAEAPFENTTWY